MTMDERVGARGFVASGVGKIPLPLEPSEIARMIPHRPVLVAYRGSLAHGTHIPPEDPSGIDDKDVMAVYIAPLEFYFGLQGGQERGLDVKIREWDCASYELRHYVRLALNANPNVLALLWTPPLYVSREGQALIDARSLFASKRAYHSFGGYAHSQMKRMVNWQDQQESACGCSGIYHQQGCRENSTRGRGSSKRFVTGFMGAKRKSLVAKHGYDTKNAAHLLRLLRMGVEFLETGEIRVDRTGIDADYLIGVKRGDYPLQSVQAEAQEWFDRMREAKDRSPLPDEPDEAKAARFLTEILSTAHTTEVVFTANEVLNRRLVSVF